MRHPGMPPAAQADTALASITRAIARINDMNTHIASAAEEQSVVAEEINRNITAINDQGNATAVGARQMNETTNELKHLVEMLEVLITQFSR